jgi:hypothetical protein
MRAEVLAQHLKIEAGIAEGNSQEVIENARTTHTAFLNLKIWLAEREAAAAGQESAEG